MILGSDRSEPEKYDQHAITLVIPAKQGVKKPVSTVPRKLGRVSLKCPEE